VNDDAGIGRENRSQTRRRVLLGTAAATALGAVGAGAHYAYKDLSPGAEGVAWLRDHAVPLATTEPGSGFADLEPLRKLIGDARIVSLGEATHGAREFFQLKHRLIEFCVSELGFNIFAMEAEFGSALAVNDYVLEGKGNAADALSGIGYWHWDTQEVLALIEWIRAWNVAHERKVKFHGFDMQGLWGDGSAAPALRLLDYLARVAHELAAESEPVLRPLVSSFFFFVLQPALKEKIRSQITKLLAAFDTERLRWIERSSETEWRVARLCATTIAQSAQFTAPGRSDDYRDQAMADNVRALLEMEGPGAKALLWAHNAHVARVQRTLNNNDGRMGGALHATFGAAHVVIGFAFNRGSFLAIDRTDEDGTIRDHVVPPGPEGTLDEVLARIGLPLLALDLRAVPPNGALARWMATKPRQWDTGLSHNPSQPHSVSRDPRADFDSLIFVASTSASRLNPTVESRLKPMVKWLRHPSTRAAATQNTQPTNLALEGKDGGGPDGWNWSGNDAVHRYAVATLPEQSAAGGNVVRIERIKVSLPWGYRILTQAFPAVAWHGRRITFRAAVRAEKVAAIGRGAQLYMRVWRPILALSRPISLSEWTRQSMEGPILVLSPCIGSSEWTRQSVSVDIPPEAELIEIALCVIGDAIGWFGDLTIEAA
jgi:erythromycin esterase